MKTNRGRGGVKPISMLTLWKIAWFFKQQIEFLLMSCLAVAKSFIKKTFFKTFFIYQHVNIFIVVIIDIYLCKKHCHLLFWVYKNIVFSPFSLLNFSFKKINKHPACKMSRDEHGESRLKIRSFEWTYFLHDPKVFLLQLRSIF